MSEILGEISEDDDDFSTSDNEENQNISTPLKNNSNLTVNVGCDNEFNRLPHDLFIQLNELVQPTDDFLEWRETARWIKYEENVEEGADRWGQPHVSSLTFHSLLNVRRCLETGVVMLDSEEKDLANVAFKAVQMVNSIVPPLLILCNTNFLKF